MRARPEQSRWTDAQWQAITATGSDILVAAAAGSGKTAVLVERIIQRIIHDGMSIDEMLVVTFTNASAKEMKERIHQALKMQMQLNPSEHLKTQLVKIHAAEISTLHRFCLNLIEQYYYTIDLDPSFRTASDEERMLLFMQAVDEVLETHYEHTDEAFLKLTLHLSGDRSDQRLRETITRLYHFAIANPYPSKWLHNISEDYRTMSTEHPLFSYLKEVVDEELSTAIHYLQEASVMLDGEVYSKHRDAVEQYLRQLKEINGPLNECAKQLKIIADLKVPAFRFKADMEDQRHDEETEAAIKNNIALAKSKIKSLSEEYLYAPPAEMAEDLQSMSDEVSMLVTITDEIITRFQQLKREKKVIDFNDYEHFALQILLKDGEPTPIALSLKEKYKEILVDEYQDTNRVQETIVQVINDHHLFMVGDVKQSIYKFRQAEPELFIEKYKRFNETEDGVIIDLARNFRSRASVIEDTNDLFLRIMDETVGEIEYDKDQQLYYGAPYDDVRQQTTLNIIESDIVDSEYPESVWIAQEIERIIAEEQVYEAASQTYRPAQYKDIVVLERSMTSANAHQMVMKQFNIPFHVNSRTGYFQTDEIRTMMSLLKIIDNPLQDIHLVGILRSLLYQMDEEELVDIRMGHQEEYFYNNLLEFQGNDTTARKINQFISDLNLFREWARTLSVRDLLERIYRKLFIVEQYSILIGGMQRKANLLGLLTKAEEFERSSYRGLSQFIRYVDNMLNEGKDFGEVNIVSDEADVVRMMTVHSSKGLEFPFVIYSALGRQFNAKDLSKEVLLTQQMGLGINFYNMSEHYSYPTIATHLFKREALRSMISEELRLMYVAFTRAREKLILLGSAKQKEIEKWQQISLDNKLDVDFRRTAKNPLSLIVATMMNHQMLNHQVKVNIIDEISPVPSSAVEEMPETIEETAAWLDDRLQYQYHDNGLNMLPTKESVSEIKRQTEVDDDATTWTLVNQYQLQRASYDRPKFLTEKKKTSAERGTLMHQVMQHFPYEEGITEDKIVEFLSSLITRHIIHQEDIKEIDVSQLIKFSRSPLYKMMCQSTEMYRELPFVIGKSYLTDESFESSPREPLVQGMIDCVFLYEGQYYFVDFKTDRFILRLGQEPHTIAEKLHEEYKVQMYYYRKALEEILNQPVKGWLYFFDYQEVEV